LPVNWAIRPAALLQQHVDPLEEEIVRAAAATAWLKMPLRPPVFGALGAWDGRLLVLGDWGANEVTNAADPERRQHKSPPNGACGSATHLLESAS